MLDARGTERDCVMGHFILSLLRKKEGAPKGLSMYTFARCANSTIPAQSAKTTVSIVAENFQNC